jgi:negative regulator of flagellin synthesis FlgM
MPWEAIEGMGYAMRITGQEIANNVRRPEHVGRNTEASQSKSSEGVENSGEVGTSDRVELSPQARDIQRAREVAQRAPEVRAEKVEASRRALQSGSLNLNGQDLADKLLQDALHAESDKA